MLDDIMKWMNKNYDTIIKDNFDVSESGKLILKKWRKCKDLFTANLIRHILNSPHMMIDRMNRYIPYAPSKTELSGDDGEPIQIENLSDKQREALESLKKVFT